MLPTLFQTAGCYAEQLPESPEEVVVPVYFGNGKQKQCSQIHAEVFGVHISNHSTVQGVSGGGRKIL
jgi:hypothetical protein